MKNILLRELQLKEGKKQIWFNSSIFKLTTDIVSRSVLCI